MQGRFGSCFRDHASGRCQEVPTWSGSVGERVESESRTSVGVASLREEGIARPHDTSTRVHARGAKENKHAPVSNPLCKRTRRRRPMVHKRSSRQPRIPQRTLPSASLRLLQSGLLGTCVAYLSSTQPGTSGLAGTARCNSLCCALHHHPAENPQRSQIRNPHTQNTYT